MSRAGWRLNEPFSNHHQRGLINAGFQANWLALRKIVPSWFWPSRGNVSYKEFQFETSNTDFTLNSENQLPPTENITRLLHQTESLSFITLGEQRASISTLCHTSLFQCFASLTGLTHFQEIAEGPTSKQLCFIYKWIYESHIFQLQRKIWIYDCLSQLHTQLLKLCV